jgi:pimeloyl-ACP methyl ester carboxylesterase
MLTCDFHRLVATPPLARKLLLSPDTDLDVARFHGELGGESFLAGLPLAWPGTLKAHRVSSPVLVLAGEKDMLFTVDEAQRTAAALNARAITFPERRHNLMMDGAWREVADAIDAWITDDLGLP